MDTLYTIYHAFDITNGKCYVGQTAEVPWTIRKDDHLKSKSSTPFARALRKRPEAFVWTVLIAGLKTQEEADTAEIYFGTFFKAMMPEGYNLRLGQGRGKHSEESKKITSETTRAAMRRPEVREKFLANYKQAIAEGRGRTGTTDSAEVREKRRQARLASPKGRGYKLSEEARKNIGRGASKEVRGPKTPEYRAATAEKVRLMWANMSPEERKRREAKRLAAFNARSIDKS